MDAQRQAGRWLWRRGSLAQIPLQGMGTPASPCWQGTVARAAPCPALQRLA